MRCASPGRWAAFRRAAAAHRPGAEELAGIQRLAHGKVGDHVLEADGSVGVEALAFGRTHTPFRLARLLVACGKVIEHGEPEVVLAHALLRNVLALVADEDAGLAP